MKSIQFILLILISFSSFASVSYTENNLTLDETIQELFNKRFIDQTEEFEVLMSDEGDLAKRIYEKGTRRSDLDYCRRAIIPGLESCWTVSIGKAGEVCS